MSSETQTPSAEPATKAAPMPTEADMLEAVCNLLDADDETRSAAKWVRELFASAHPSPDIRDAERWRDDTLAEAVDKFLEAWAHGNEGDIAKAVTAMRYAVRRDHPVPGTTFRGVVSSAQPTDRLYARIAELEAALSTARADALREAADVCEQEEAKNYKPQFRWLALRCAERIRSLIPPQEK